MNIENCKCHNPPFLYSDYTKHYVGIDETNGRFGEVTFKTCKYCNSLWLHYYVTYEAFSQSGRWYRGLITQSDAENITPENSVNYLKSLKWYFYGGSYFNTSGKKGSGRVSVDL